jgi:hypothetical protein
LLPPFWKSSETSLAALWTVIDALMVAIQQREANGLREAEPRSVLGACMHCARKHNKENEKVPERVTGSLRGMMRSCSISFGGRGGYAGRQLHGCTRDGRGGKQYLEAHRLFVTARSASQCRLLPALRIRQAHGASLCEGSEGQHAPRSLQAG